MKHTPTVQSSDFRLLFRTCFASLLVLLSSIFVAAQTSSPTDGTTPLGLSPGAPAGSYALSGFDNINPYNGNLNFRLLLVGIGGRGEARMSSTFALDSVKWKVETEVSSIEGGGECLPGQEEGCYRPPYEGGGPYTTMHYPTPENWEGIKVGYGPGVMHGRNGRHKGSQSQATSTLTRLTFTTPDGTEYELRDELTEGQPYAGSYVGERTRGTIFKTADGTAATFISDVTIIDAIVGTDLIYPSGYLLLSDGIRYRVDGGLVTWIRDRNGNKLSFAYDVYKRVTVITDSLNRQISVTYANMSTVFYDQLTYKGFGGSLRVIKVWYQMLSQSLRAGYAVQTYQQLFPNLDGSDTTVYNPAVVSAIELPNGRSYQLLYNPYGELARVVLPSGGVIEYDYVDMSVDNNIHRRVAERRVYANGTALESKQVYSANYSGGTPYPTNIVIEQRNAANSLLAKSKHYFFGNPSSMSGTAVSYPGWKEGREYQTETFDANGTTVLRKIENSWEQREPVSWWLGDPELGPPNDTRITETPTTLVDTNQVSKQTFGYDDSVPFNNQNNVKEYAFGAGAAGALLRETRTVFLTAAGYVGTGAHLRRLPTQVSVYDSGGIERARTTYEYDNYTATANHAPLWPRTLISGHDASFTTSYLTRGNQTKVTNWILSPLTQISSYAQYDVAGNVVKAIDARGYDTDFGFADCYGTPNGEARTNIAPNELASQSQTSYALATSVTNALGHVSYAQYDYYLGQAVDAEDVNGIEASGYFNDALDRPTQVRRAVGTTVVNQTTYAYDDTNRIATTTSDFDTYNDTTPLKSQTLYDGLGRTTETRQYEGGTNYIAVQTQYDALGRAFKSSNPFRPWQSETVVWTTSAFDALGRMITVSTPDNAVVSTSYSGNTVTVTDQAGKKRKSVTDALGRLTQVYEDPTALNYLTSYAYDVLDNLTTVTQGTQTRTFVYDSLKRLKTATNPESGTVTYTYDNNNNLLTKTDARSIVTTFTYDALNRPTLKNYSDTTPDVNYFYDAQALPAGAPAYDRGFSIGRLVAVTTGGTNAGTYRGYDAIGQVLRQYQRADSVNYLVEATYNKAGAMQTQTYPSVPGASGRRTVSYAFDVAGRLASLNSPETTYAPAASVSTTTYASNGGLASETLGNTLIHAQVYNNRLQPTQIKLGTAGNPTSVINLTYNYGTTTNNGNVLSTTYAGGGLSYTQTFGYDALNRLTTSQEGASWSQTNSYDRYGNRAVIGAALTFNASNNRITTAGYTYDAVGNLTSDSTQSFTYDAENKITKVNNVSAYVYDGEGQRVRKLVGENLRFMYDVGGKQIAEFDGTSGDLKKEYIYGASGLVATIEPTAVNANGTRYTTSDHLGTPRVITSSSAGVVSRHDFKPFGEEIGAGIGARTIGMGYSVADGLRQKFTQKERDLETGLDYFLARYYSSPQGRFTSPDEFSGGPDELYDFVEAASENPTFYADLTNPQSLNKYQYTYNNPLRYTDPDGHCPPEAAALCRLAPVVVTIPGLREAAAGAAVVVILAKAIDSIPGDKTAGDGSCPSCEVSLRQGQKRLEQQEKQQRAKQLGESAQGGAEGSSQESGPQEPYDRRKHYGNTPTKGDRKAVGGESTDHNPPLVKRYYEGDPGKGEKPGHRQTREERRGSANDRSRMRPATKREQSQQGGRMSDYSKKKKKEHGLN